MATEDKLVINGPVPRLIGAKGADGEIGSQAVSEVKETPFEALASICSVLVIGMFILTFLAQNFLIPSGSMLDALLVGDHLLVDRITIAPRPSWMPLVHYREPKRGDIVVFFGPGQPDTHLVKRLIGVPGDHIHLRNGIVILNGVAQNEPYVKPRPEDVYSPYIDDFPSVPTSEASGVTAEWAVDLPNHIQGNDLVVPPGMYFMMGDNRHNSNDGRFWGFTPRANIVGRPLFNYWSFKTPDDQMYKTGLANQIAWMGNVVLHFFTDTRWKRTLNPVR
ncbi:signal peptidase I [Acidicapsa acidisoli]|uniref:signal peptidase I n=1 Tax=Acidicapsa acidisoli TaxID=1615681 RepID=UPI0021DFE3A3|nr:signal peptidase I [Acidicapsa acidisoli]